MEIKGLTSEEVNLRVQQGLTNTTNIKTDKTNKEIVYSNIFTYFNLIFTILAVLVIISGQFKSLAFMIVVIINACVGIFQELRAKKVLDEMNLLNAPVSNCIRDKVLTKIKSEELVKDDVIVLEAGNQICADCVVINGELQVNESLLTGEQDSVKKVLDDKLLSGSYVVSGKAYCRLEAVGDASYISKLALEAKSMNKQGQSEMIKSINQIVKWAGIVIIPIGIALFYQAHFINGETFSKSIVSMVAAVIGMIPEGLYLLTTMALTLSTIRLSKDKVLLHDMKSIESLARVDVLCVDKTGTITKSDMEVKEIVPLKGDLNDIKELLKIYSDSITDSNATIEALRYYLQDENVEDFKVLKMMPFASDKKYSMVSFKEGNYEK